MKGIFSQTKRLLKESWDILKNDKRLLLIPIIPVIFAIVIIGIGLYFFVSILKTGNLESWLAVLVFSLAALLLIFVFGTFFNIVLFSCINDKFKDRTASFKRGFLIAVKNFRKIISWAIIGTGAHTAFSEAPGGVVTKVATEAGRKTWQMITTFVVPVMIFEDKGVTEAVGRSVYLFTKTWGATVVGRFSISLTFFINALISAGLGFGLSYLYLEFFPFQTIIPIAILWVLLILYVIAEGLIVSTLGGIFNIALYHYACTGQIPSGFTEKTIRNSYSPKLP